MNDPLDLRIALYRSALDSWLSDQKRRMNLRFPLIDFESNYWPIRTLYKTEQLDWYFTEPFADFAGKDVSYRDALRCIVAEMVIAGIPKTLPAPISAYRLLARTTQSSLFYLTIEDLRQIEIEILSDARATPASALSMGSKISNLANRIVPLLTSRSIIPRLGFTPRDDIKAALMKIGLTHKRLAKEAEIDMLDQKMKAINDAFDALVANPLDRNGNPVLSAMDRLAICVAVILLCAPSRINEPLCMSIDDIITIDDYATGKKKADWDAMHDVHKLLLMKGSKGAQWSAKPALQFMIGALDYCIGIVREQGKHSRMLVEWYLKYPKALYLPPTLEHLRGKAISRLQFAQIIYNTPTPSRTNQLSYANGLFAKLKDRWFRGQNPMRMTASGKPTSSPITDLVAWADVEAFLLKEVHQAMEACRRVSRLNHYQGDLSKMLFLYDDDELPFKPGSITYKMIRCRFKRIKSDSGRVEPTLFQKLNITIPFGGKIQAAEIDTHDLRHWLTTQALIHGENLSNVLINKWANRLSLWQLLAYDKRYPEFKAAQSAMPEAPELNELADISNGLTAVEKLEDQFGLSMAIVTAHDAGIAMTSMHAVTHAVENRPVAKSSRGIIIIYPQRFGVCFHQHHEKPCRNYSNDLSASCVTCNEGAFVKGHIPTNDEMRKIADQLFGSILRHLENLAVSHNRDIADDPAMLGEHMLTLIEKGLDRVTMVQLATHLIDHFHELNRTIKDRLLANRLHQAFVSREVVRKLDDQGICSGALIKYHNPTQHAEPLLEVALDAHGGREQVLRDDQMLIAKHPQFAPKALGLNDQRHLIAPDDDKGEG